MPKDRLLTSVSRWRVSELVSVPRCQPHTDVSTWQRPASFERQLLLDRAIRQVTPIGNVEERARVTAIRHEYLGCVICCGVLKKTSSVNRAFPHSLWRNTNLAVYDCSNWQPRNDSILQCQIAGLVSRRVEVEMSIPASGLPKVHETVVDDGVGSVLDLNGKAGGNVVGQGLSGG